MTPTAPRAFVALGGNVGDVAATFASALRELASVPGLSLIAVSGRYRTPPWGPVAQPPYVNAVAELAASLAPLDLLDHLLACERRHGRNRAQEQRWGPRTLDLDLLALGDTVMDHPRLQLPHPRLADRAFVLVPWADLAPDWPVAGHGRVADLLARVDRSGIEALP
jgi:2-amino-4-hydroxy-6-hydroxymethyldihydropteridine diphosphokinase